MTTLQKIQSMPERKREQILWAIVGSVLVVMLLLWIVTSRLPRPTRSAGDFAHMVKQRMQQARADFPK